MIRMVILLAIQKRFYQVLETQEKDICRIPDFHSMTELPWSTHIAGKVHALANLRFWSISLS